MAINLLCQAINVDCKIYHCYEFKVIDDAMEKKRGRGWLGEGRREGSTRRRGRWKTRPLLRIYEKVISIM
jgi:hypothetical protein